MRRSYLFALALLMLSCSEEENPAGGQQGGNDKPVTTTTTLSINCNRPGNTDDIVIGAWEKGTVIQVGEYISKPLSEIDGTTADFEFAEKFSRPFNVLWPVSAYVDNEKIRIEATDPTIPFAAYVGKGQPVWLMPVCGGLRIPVKGGYADSETEYTLNRLEVSGVREEQMSGEFGINWRTLALTSTETSPESKKICATYSVKLSAQTEEEIEVILPAGEYESGLALKFGATDGSSYEYVTSSSFVVEAGNYTKLPLIWYRPGEVQSMISGYVKDTAGNPIPGVVVSDGLNAAKTDRDGKYILPLSPEEFEPRFVFVSTPAEYAAPVANGLPQFYKTWDECKTLSSVDFELVPITGSVDRCTLFVIGDPQIRGRGARSDRIAYYSIDAMHDTFRDLRECSSSVGRRCYGVVVGDIVSGVPASTAHFSDYKADCATLNFPMYNLMGNHDHNSDATTELESYQDYENNLGPRNYSFDLGGFHVVCLDDQPVKIGKGGNATGLTDKDFQWLKNDLSHIPYNTQLIVCAHSTMFMASTGHDMSKDSGVLNSSGYSELLSKYAKVYHFAGHSHSMFNYVYPEDSEYRNIEVHVVPRCTGILNLNEYIADGGSPRGFVICEIDGERITWKYHVTPYLTGENMASVPPNYDCRPWTYNGGVAYIGSSVLNDSHQIHAYDGGVYPDGCVYANVYMWDELWGKVYLKVNGGGQYEMQRVPAGDPYMYDAANKEIIEHYNNYHEYFNVYGHRVCSNVHHLFRVKPNEKTGTGTIMVTDRFGQTYSAIVKW